MFAENDCVENDNSGNHFKESHGFLGTLRKASWLINNMETRERVSSPLHAQSASAAQYLPGLLANAEGKKLP